MRLTISGRWSRPLAIGDTYTLWRPGCDIEDVSVTDVTRGGRGWVAHCQIVETAAP